MQVKIGDKVFYKSAGAFGETSEKFGVVEKVNGDKVYLGRRRWVQVKNIVRIASQSNGK
jgi:hypothetical protein